MPKCYLVLMENLSTQTINVKSNKSNKFNHKSSKVAESGLVQSEYIPLINEENVSILVNADNNENSKSYLIKYKGLNSYIISIENESVSVKEFGFYSFPYFDHYDAFVNPITKLFAFIGIQVPDIVIDIIFSKSYKYIESVESSKINDEILTKVSLERLIKANRYDLIERLGYLVRFKKEDTRGLDFSKLSNDSINTIVKNIVYDAGFTYLFNLKDYLIKENKDLQMSILANEFISAREMSLLFDHNDADILYLLKAKLYFEDKSNCLSFLEKTKLNRKWSMFFDIFSGKDVDYSLFDVLEKPTKREVMFFLSNNNVLSSFVKFLKLNPENENDTFFAKSLIFDCDCIQSCISHEINNTLKKEALTYLVRNRRWDEFDNIRCVMDTVKFKTSELIDLLKTKHCLEIRFRSEFNSIFELLTDDDFLSICESSPHLMSFLLCHRALNERHLRIVKIKKGIDFNI